MARATPARRPSELDRERAHPPAPALAERHRYALAAELCAGLRVADLTTGDAGGAGLLAEAAGALVAVGDVAAADVASADFDAIVMLAGLERLADPPAALARLRAHADAGLLVIVALDQALAGLAERGEPQLMLQYRAEGSLIRDAERPGTAEAAASAPEPAERQPPDWVIAIFNADRAAAKAHASTRVELRPARLDDDRVRDLERANVQLLRTNRRLARERLGVADSAAAARLGEAAAPDLPRYLVPLSIVLDRGLRVLSTIVLNVLPHGLTLALLGARRRRRRADG